MVKVLCYKSEVRWFDPSCYYRNCSLTKSFRSHYGPGIDTASNRNEYQEDFVGGKCGRCVRLTSLPPPCAVVMKSWNLNFLETSGLLRACNGTDLSFFFFLKLNCYKRLFVLYFTFYSNNENVSSNTESFNVKVKVSLTTS